MTGPRRWPPRRKEVLIPCKYKKYKRRKVGVAWGEVGKKKKKNRRKSVEVCPSPFFSFNLDFRFTFFHSLCYSLASILISSPLRDACERERV